MDSLWGWITRRPKHSGAAAVLAWAMTQAGVVSAAEPRPQLSQGLFAATEHAASIETGHSSPCDVCPGDVHPWHPGQMVSPDGSAAPGQTPPGAMPPGRGAQTAASGGLFSAASSPSAAAPNMIGDFFGAGGSSTNIGAGVGIPMTFSAGAGFSPMLVGMDTLQFNGQIASFTAINSFSFENLMNPNVDTIGNQIGLQQNPNFTGLIVQQTGAIGADFDQSFAELLQNDVMAGLQPGDNYAIFADYDVFYVPGKFFVIPSPSAGGANVGRQKIAENCSPIPRDRVFFNYSHFDNVPLTASGVNINRYTPGFEKTFNDQRSSFEMRFPFATTLDTNFVVNGATDESNLQLGNLTMYFKHLFYESYDWNWSFGLGVTVPTGDDLNIGLANGLQLIEVQNDAVHMLPFIGWLYTPNDRFFFQGFCQLDYDLNGNDVRVTDGARLRPAGVATDPTFLYIDAGIGYWLYRDHCASWITGVAPTLEIHHNRSLDNTDPVFRGPFVVGEYEQDIQVTNGVVGATLLMGDNKTLTCAYAAPLGNGADQQFDGELRLIFNWFFGGRVYGGTAGLPGLGILR